MQAIDKDQSGSISVCVCQCQAAYPCLGRLETFGEVVPCHLYTLFSLLLSCAFKLQFYFAKAE